MEPKDHDHLQRARGDSGRPLERLGRVAAGTYVFKILDSPTDRHIVQIFSQDETTVYATILAIPNYRLKATDKTVMTFRERPAGQPEALRAWFYPGKNWGEEFVYPKAKAMELAKSTNVPVLFTAAELPVEVAEPVKLADAPVVAELKRAPIMAAKPTGEEVQLAEVVTTPPALMQLAAAKPAGSCRPPPAPCRCSDCWACWPSARPLRARSAANRLR